MKDLTIIPSKEEFERYLDHDKIPVALVQEAPGMADYLLKSMIGSEPYLVVFECMRDQKPYSPITYIIRPESPIFSPKGLDMGPETRAHIQALGHRSAPTINGLPAFQGGYWAMFSYDATRVLDKYLSNRVRASEFPGLIAFRVEEFLAYDQKSCLLFLVNERDPGRGYPIRERYDERVKALRARLESLLGDLNREISLKKQSPIKIEPLMEKNAFISKVSFAKELILEGQCIQVVLSQRFLIRGVKDPYASYLRLRAQNPSPYCTYMKCEDFFLVAASPEMQVRVQENKMFLRPIAGTRPRTGDIDKDRRLALSLKNDPKELAEHVMLLDLGRNDVGKISLPGTVNVTDFMALEMYSRVMHLVSQVEGRVPRQLGLLEILKATFPAGTVTGAPKIRAMEIIDRLEAEARGPYGGAFGLIGSNGYLDLGITIRAAFGYEDRIFVQAGAGIVADSRPEMEYLETKQKAEALIEAFGGEKP